MTHSLPQPPGSFGAPLIGEIREWLADPLAFARERAQRYGPVWRTHLLGRPTVVLLEPAGNEFILMSGRDHFSWRDGWGRSMLRLMGGGLSLSDGAEHAQRRAALRPAFTHATLQHEIPALAEHVRATCVQWAAQPTVTALHVLKSLAFEIALKVVCGSVPHAIAQTLHADFDTFTAGLFTPFPWPVPGTPYGRAKSAGKRLRRALHTLVALRRETLDLTAQDGLSLLLTQLELDQEEIVSELLLLLWAGHDTVASLLSWVMYELGLHPNYLERIRTEAERVIGNAPVTAVHLRQLPELDRVLRECERLHPPAPGGFRGVTTAFDYQGCHIPAGWLAMYSSVYTHTMPTLWHNAQEFFPDRFADPYNEGHTPYSLIGFGGGPRICIGLALAQLEMRLIMLELARYYTWTLQPNQRYTQVWLPTNQPQDGLIVQIHSRL